MENIIVCTYDEKLLPQVKTSGSVCWDLRIEDDLQVQPWEIKTISTGIKTYIPVWRCAKVYARSWLPVKSWLMLANSVAIFDADYRWEYIMQFYNFGQEVKKYDKYTRLTQIEFMPYYIITQGKRGNEFIPGIEFIVDQNTYDKFDEIYSSQRWAGGLHSTWR